MRATPDVARAGPTSARRRKGRRMRSFFRHEQVAIEMAVVTAQHHSAQRCCTIATQTVDSTSVIEYVAPAPAVTYAAPAPVDGYVAPAPAVTYAAPAPVIDFAAPAHSVTFAVPAPVIDSVGRIHFHPKSISSTDTFIQTRFHPMTLSSKNGFIQ